MKDVNSKYSQELEYLQKSTENMLLDPKGKRPVLIWLYTGMFLVFSMVIVGAITRLTESGLSITEWNVITGALPPMSDEAWMEEFDKYRETPEYRDKNVYAFGTGDEALENFKKIFWWEWIHRFLGRVIGVIFIIPFLIFWKRGYFKKAIMPRLLLILFLGGFQGFLGWYMVKSGLSSEPRVSHYRLAMHLGNALLTYSVIWWLILDIRHPRLTHLRDKFPVAKRIWWVTFIILVIQIIYGAFVAGKDAGQLYNTWPLMGNKFIADGAFDQQPFWVNLLAESVNEGPNLAGIQFIHRWLAVVLYLSVAVLWMYSGRKNLRHDQKELANWMFLTVNIQFLLGVLTLIYAVPVWLGVLHQAGAVVLLTFSLYYYHQIRGTE